MDTDQTIIEGKIVDEFMRHAAWGLLEPWLKEQESSDRLLDCKSFEEYQLRLKEIEFIRSFKGTVESYLNNLNQK